MQRPWPAEAPSAWGRPPVRPRPPRRGAGSKAFAHVPERRARFLFYFFAALACYLVYHLYDVQIRRGPGLAEKARLQHEATIPLYALRGTIYDRDGNVLARSLPGQSVYVSIFEVKDKAATARGLALALGLHPDEVAARLDVRAGYVPIARKVSPEAAQRVRELNLPGVDVMREKSGLRFVPSGTLAPHVLGFTGIDENGLEGVEYSFDDLLRAKPGTEVSEGDQWGRELPFGGSHVVTQPRPGYSLVLTVDSYLQYETENELRRTVAEWHAASGSALVMDPNTGEILALANVPDYDVSRYASARPDRRRDRAVADLYEPGSTFKLVTAAAALDSGKVSPTDRFPARDKIVVGGRTIHNAEDGFLAGSAQSETLGDIVAYSHNVGAAEVGLAIGERTMYDALRRFGIGDETHSGLQGESAGLLPSLPDWSASSLPTIAFGHGVATTPLGLARVYCAIANGGLLLRPRILASILDSDGKPVYRYAPEVEHRAISAGTAAILRRYLRRVVTNGTGNPTAQVEGYTTAGKTGTAQVAEGGGYVPGEYVASFVGYVPADHPRYLILVKVERPRGAIYGSVVAAPAFARLARLAMLHAGILPATAPAPSRLVKPPRAAKKRA